MSIFEIAAILIGLSALFGFLNYRFLQLPHTIGLVVIALAASLVVIVIEIVWPQSALSEVVTGALNEIDFHDAVMRGMLSFLLFAGALGRGISADHDTVPLALVHTRCSPDPDLGRTTRWNRRGAVAVAAGKRIQADDSDDHLRGCTVFDHRARFDDQTAG